MSVKDAMDAVREIEAGKGAQDDPEKRVEREESQKVEQKPEAKTPVPPAEPEEAKKKPEKAPAPEKKAEKPAEDPLEAVRRENEELRRRLDAVERQKAQVPPEKPKQPDNPLLQYSDDELLAYKYEHPEHAVKIDKELLRRTKESAQTELRSEYQQAQLKAAHDAAAYQEYPELKDVSSEMYKLTQQILDAYPEQRDQPTAFRAAAREARRTIVERELKDLRQHQADAESERERLAQERERSKNRDGLHSGGRAPDAEPTDDDKFEESFNDLPSARPGSPELLRHMRALEARKVK